MLVSCYYTNLMGTKFGGRPNSFKRRYLNGILRLSENNEKKVIYTSSESFNDLNTYLKENLDEKKLSLYEIKVFELENQIFHNKIQNLKNKYGYIGDRCLEVQYGKFQFLMNEINNDDFIWWIDAGLIDEHLFLIEQVKNLNKFNLFNDKFFQKLRKNVPDSMVFTCGDRENYYNHVAPDKKYFTKNYQKRYHPVGGFFGGEKNTLEEFLILCKQKINLVLNDNELYSEETIMEIVFSEEIEKYKYESFTTWVHEERGAYERMTEEEKTQFKINQKPYYKSVMKMY